MKYRNITFVMGMLVLTLNGGFGMDKIQGSSRKIEAVKVGDVLPNLVLTDTEHHNVRIQEYLKTQPLILIYYRGGW